MKNYTDVEQSKNLSEILPPESADMHYIVVENDYEQQPSYIVGLGKYIGILPNFPCWSLAVLTDILRKDFEVCIIGYEKAWKCHVTNRKTLVTDWLLADNPIDCCYEMIVKLHEQKLL